MEGSSRNLNFYIKCLNKERLSEKVNLFEILELMNQYNIFTPKVSVLYRPSKINFMLHVLLFIIALFKVGVQT